MRNNFSKLGLMPEEPTAVGVARAVSRAIREGILTPGTKLPPVRAVASQFGLSPTTVSSAWRMLARSGTIRTEGRRGTTVADNYSGSVRYHQAMDHHRLFAQDLSTGTPDPKLLPDLEPALKQLTTTAVTGGYLDDPVVPELVEQLRMHWPYDAAQFMVVDGAMDALELAARTTIHFGDRVIVEDPSFPLLLDQLEMAGAEIIGVPLDEQGMRADALEVAIKKPAAAVVMQPRAHNPTGVSMTQARAKELVQVLGATDTVVIEDDSTGPIAATPAISLGQWLPDQTLHIRSFSKSHGPDLRLAAMSGPASLVRDIAARRQLGQGWSSRLLQRILLTLLTDGTAVARVARARTEYQQRRRAVTSALAEEGIDIAGTDGFNIWVPVANETAALVTLASQGIGAAAGAPFSVNQNHAGHIRVTISSVAKMPDRLAKQIATAAHAESLRAGR